MKKHEIGSGTVHGGPRVLVSITNPRKFGSRVPLLLMEIEICMSSIMKNHKIGSDTVPGSPRV